MEVTIGCPLRSEQNAHEDQEDREVRIYSRIYLRSGYKIYGSQDRVSIDKSQGRFFYGD